MPNSRRMPVWMILALTIVLAPLTSSVLPVTAASPRLVLQPRTGSPGTQVAVRGTNFPEMTEGRLRWGADGTALTSFQTDRRGGFAATFVVPETGVGRVPVIAEADDVAVTETFVVEERSARSVEPRVSIQEATTPPEERAADEAPAVSREQAEAPTPTPSPPPTPVPAPTTVAWTPFVDDFESGDLVRWDTVAGLTVQTVEVLDGSYAARATSTGREPAYARANLATPQPELFARVRFKLLAQQGGPVTLLGVRTAADASLLRLAVGADGTLSVRNETTGEWRSSEAVVSQGVWHEVQVHVRVGAAGLVEVWLDGAGLAALSGPVGLGAAPLGRMQLGESAAGVGYDVAFDGVRVDTTPISFDPRFRPKSPPAPTATAVPANEETPLVVPESVSESGSDDGMSSLAAAAVETSPAVVGLVLINAETDQPIGPLTDGAVLNLAALPSRHLNVRADTDPATVGSVRFALDANPSFRIENTPPYALAGDQAGDYHTWTPSVGTHTLTAVPYPEPGAGGMAGTDLVISFTVVDEADVEPNPTATATGTSTATATSPAGGDPTPGGLRGEYFNTRDLTNSVLVRTDATVNFDWGTGSPHPAVNPDNFSVRWTGQVLATESATYTFATTTNDGARLWVNGRLLVDKWINQAATEHSGTITLQAGRWYPIQLEYYEGVGTAVARLSYSSPNTPKQVIPATHLSPDPPGGTVPPTATATATATSPAGSAPTPGGLRGEYFNTRDLTNSVLVRTDPTIDFNWGSGSPAPAVNPDNFSVRWTGQVLAAESATYTFATTTNDGARLWVDGQLLVDRWVNQAATEHSGTIALQAGTWYPIVFEYYEGTGTAVARLSYSAPNTPKQVIPATQLSPDPPGGATPSPPTATATSAPTPTPGSGPTPVSSECSTTIQALVDSAPSGAVVRVPPCIYREAVTINKPLILDGQGGAEIRGSDVWTGWNRSGSVWVSTKTVPSFGTTGTCQSGTQRCHWPEQVFFDGQNLLQVQGTPSSGQFAVDGSRRIVLGSDPTGHTVEVTTRAFWVRGASASVGNVTIRNFTMQHAANKRVGALTSSAGSGWVIENNELAWSHSWNLEIKGPDSRIVGNDIHHAGGLGVAPGGDRMYLAHNKIHHNNTEGFYPGESGGVKSVGVSGGLWEYNEVYANDGSGLWCDIDCIGLTIRYNRVHHNNQNGGIFYELSRDGKIYGNVVWENNFGYTSGGAGGGIILGNSANTEVYDNVVAWNADGITVLSYDRGNTTWNKVTGNYVHDNTIIMDGRVKVHTGLGWFQNWDGILCNSGSNNRGANNDYWFSTPEPTTDRFVWCTGRSTLASFNGTPGENGGRYISVSERDQVLRDAGVPLAPGG